MNRIELNDIIEIHGKAIYGFCHRLAVNAADADDLYQETFLKAMEMSHRIDKDGNPKSFFISIAVGLWKNKRRKFAWRQRIAPTEAMYEGIDEDCVASAAASPEEQVMSAELRNLILNAAGELSEKLRITLYLYYTAELSIPEIAAALKIPQGTVKSRLHKAREEMKYVLEVNNYEEF